MSGQGVSGMSGGNCSWPPNVELLASAVGDAEKSAGFISSHKKTAVTAIELREIIRSISLLLLSIEARQVDHQSHRPVDLPCRMARLTACTRRDCSFRSSRPPYH